MHNRIILTALLCACVRALAADHAPLPEQLIAARTAFIDNKSGEPAFADNIYQQLKEWGRWRVVTSRIDADVLVVLDHKERFKNKFYFSVVDRESGEVLWAKQKDVALRIWGQLSRKLMQDLRKRLPPDAPGK